MSEDTKSPNSIGNVHGKDIKLVEIGTEAKGLRVPPPTGAIFEGGLNVPPPPPQAKTTSGQGASGDAQPTVAASTTGVAPSSASPSSAGSQGS